MSLHAERAAHGAASHRTHAWACILTVATGMIMATSMAQLHMHDGYSIAMTV